MESSNIQRDALCVYFVKVQINFQGAGGWKPRLADNQTLATPPVKCIFPNLKCAR